MFNCFKNENMEVKKKKNAILKATIQFEENYIKLMDYTQPAFSHFSSENVHDVYN